MIYIIEIFHVKMMSVINSAILMSVTPYFVDNEQFLTILNVQGGPKADTQFYFWDNFANSAPILTILSLLQAAPR